MGRINQRTSKKKHIALILVLIICLMFSACGDATVIEPDLTVETTGNSLSLDEGESLQKESEIITSEEETEAAESNETEEDTEEEGSSEVEAESDATDNATADVSSECGHVWSEWRALEKATCERNGSQLRECTSCGEREEQVVLASGHAMKNGVCSVCGYEEQKECKHDKTDWIVTKEATCTETGSRNQVCLSCEAVLSTKTLPALGHTIKDTAAKAATCTENGWEAYQSCTFCGYSTKKEIKATGHQYQEGTCKVCGSKDPFYVPPLEKITVPALEKKEHSIAGITKSETSIPAAEMIVYNGNITEKGQMDTYTYTVSRDGKYRFEFSEMMSGTRVYLGIYDHLGKRVSDSYCYNEDGITVENLKQGEVYQIKIEQEKNFSNYTLSIGQQKPVVDISGYTEISDSIEYKDQINVYTFSALVDGRYRFEISKMMSGTRVYLGIYDHLGKCVGDGYCYNEEGITVENLKQGEVYQIRIEQEKNLSNYMLSIGQQKPVVDVSSRVEISDSIEYEDQINIYNFAADESGNHNLTVSGMTNGTTVQLYVFNQLGEEVAYDRSCVNGDSIQLKNLEIGTQYEIQIRQKTGTSSYILTIK